jgi:hypothetical protein
MGFTFRVQLNDGDWYEASAIRTSGSDVVLTLLNGEEQVASASEVTEIYVADSQEDEV